MSYRVYVGKCEIQQALFSIHNLHIYWNLCANLINNVQEFAKYL